MADNVSPEMGSEPAELSIDDAVQALSKQKAPEESATENEQETTEDEQAEPEQSESQQEEAEAPEEENASEEDAEPEIKDDVLIKLDDGSTITVSELKSKASTLEADNARISQEVATERRELQQLGERTAKSFDAVVEYLASKLPPEPEQSLLWSDPARHHQMTYIRQAAIQELQSLLQVKETVEETVSKISDVEMAKYQETEKAALIKTDPNLKDPARYKAAMDKTKAYLKTVGFDDAMIEATHDAKMLRVAMDAAYGKEARENAIKAKAQVKTAVAKTSPQSRPVSKNSIQALNKVNAMKRFEKTGKIEDALAALRSG